jgi:hypothetical protein
MSRSFAEDLADERAHRIASAAAEEFVRCDGMPNGPDSYIIALPDDDYGKDCIEHLKWHGNAAVLDTADDAYLEVIFGDFTLGSLSP